MSKETGDNYESNYERYRSHDEKAYIRNLAEIKFCYLYKLVYAISNHHQIGACEKLVYRGWAVELAPIQVDGKHKRVFEFTAKGWDETDFIDVV